MNVVRLLVLGAIREGGASYGYAIQQTLDDWQVRTWTRLHSGSVYHALQQMTKESVQAGAELTQQKATRKLADGKELTGIRATVKTRAESARPWRAST